jgi:pimeloyl-ACP methyl ester carboxylesterase
VVDACAKDTACSSAFPDPSADLDALLREDITRSVVLDPVTGGETTVTLDRDARIGLVRGALYTPRHAALLPLALRRAASGDYGPLFAIGRATESWSVDTMAVGATLAVLCADEAPTLSRQQAALLTAGTFVGDSYARFWLDACEGLTGIASGSESPTPPGRPLGVPALVLSGERDPVTPPDAGEQAVRAFARAAHVVVPGAGHNVSHLGCLPELMRSFLDAADPAAVDPSCVAPHPPTPFAIDATGFRP